MKFIFKKDLKPNDLKKNLLQRSILLKIGKSAIAVIKARTLSGEFLPGSSDKATTYSTSPAPIPLGGFFAKVGKKRGAKIWKQIKDEVTYFTKNKQVWIILHGGYKRLRELTGRETQNVTLNWSDKMMRALKILNVNTETGQIFVGFTDNRSAELAGFHHEGVGKSKVKRLFVGLTKEELQRIADEVRF